MHQLIYIVRMHTIYYYTSGGWAGFKMSALRKSGKRFISLYLRNKESAELFQHTFS